MTRTTVAFLLSGFLAACGGAAESVSPKSASGGERAAPDRSCPAAVAGTSVSVQDTERGVALVFATTGDVAEVRARAAELARRHNEHHSAMGPLPTGDEAAGTTHAHGTSGHDGHGATHGGGHHGHRAAHGASGHDGHGSADGHAAPGGRAQGGGHPAGHAGGMIGVHSRAEVDEIAGGARVVFVSAPGDANQLRDELATHARHMAAGTCQMGHGG